MKCHELDVYLADYLEGELAEPATAELLDHVQSCETCRREFQSYEQQEAALRRYYGMRLERVLQLPNPIEHGTSYEDESGRKNRRATFMAVAALLIAAVGAGSWFFLRDGLSTLPMAEVKEATGRILVMNRGNFVPAGPRTPIMEGERIKVSPASYLSLQFPDGNILEAREGTQVTLHDFANKIEISMNRGSVWAHLNTPPKKKFVVQTAHLRATATGTVYGVEEGIDRSIVQVAEGAVLVESGGQQTIVEAGSTFSSRDGILTSPIADATSWSHHPEDLGAIAAKESTVAASAESALAVQSSEIVRPASSAPIQLTSLSGDVVPPNISDLVDVLPIDSRFLLDIRDWPGVLNEFRTSDYKKIADDPSIQEWSNEIHAEEIMNGFINELHLLEVLDIAKLVDGQLTIGVRGDGHFVMVADCVSHEAEVRALLEKIMAPPEASLASDPRNKPSADLIQDLLRQNAAREANSIGTELNGHLLIERGRLILSSNRDLASEAAARISLGQTSGFAQSEFCRKVRTAANQARFLLAADLSEIIAQASEGANEEQAATYNFLGLPGLDYLLVSPNFVSRGMNQAARLGFKGTRYGAANWLAEPSPMRGLDFFSSDVLFFTSAIARSPRQMFFDFLFMLEKSGDQNQYDQTKRFFDENQAFFDALQGEIAIGVDVPVLPIPNIKLALEVADPAGFAPLLAGFIDDTVKAYEAEGKQVHVEEQEHKGILIRTVIVDGAPFDPSYAFVDDYLVVGPGTEFVRNSIDVYRSGLSITHNSRLASLLPSQSQMNYSILVYQDIARALPDLSKALPVFGDATKDLLPNAEFLQNYRTPGVAYAYAYPTHIDFYMNASTGVDLNLGMAAPLVANWLLPRSNMGRTLDRYFEAKDRLESVQAAVSAYEKDKGQAPQSLADLAKPAGNYLNSVPEDPFALVPGEPLRMTQGASAGEIILYSIGPDTIDDNGKVDYNPQNGIDSGGDILVRVGQATP